MTAEESYTAIIGAMTTLLGVIQQEGLTLDLWGTNAALLEVFCEINENPMEILKEYLNA